jgi:alkanesulfonate monooxygenase SsuD/methylene tetrahydromethanopterin reductase-like flavin-dependent oxidoreductase (luciferase family)
MVTSEASRGDGRPGQLVIGAMVRPLGAFPSGWRHPGAHRNPAGDPQALKRVARTAEKAALDYLFLGDWLSTSVELEYTEPHLLARIDPLSSAAFLAAVTSRIGIIGTASTAHTEPYAIARTAASIDRLSAGRFGLNLTVGTDPQAEANFGRPGAAPGGNRFEAAVEYVEVLRGLWESWDDGAFVADAASGELLDRSLVSALDHRGREFEVSGPLNALRPVQGHVPLVHTGVSPRAKEFAASSADLYVVAPTSLGDAVRLYRETKLRIAALGRDASAVAIVAPVLPIVASTTEEAHAVYDTLVELVPLETEGAPGKAAGPVPADRRLPANRTVASLLQYVGLPLLERRADDAVTPATAERFNAGGRRLVEIVTARSGRTIGGARPISYRQLLVAYLIQAPIVVGSAEEIADHFERWFRARAVDGFTVQSAFLHQQFEAFTELVIPELQQRGLFRNGYTERTLRGHIGLPPAGDRAGRAEGSADLTTRPETRRRHDQADLVQPLRDEHRGPHLPRSLGASGEQPAPLQRPRFLG